MTTSPDKRMENKAFLRVSAPVLFGIVGFRPNYAVFVRRQIVGAETLPKLPSAHRRRGLRN